MSFRFEDGVGALLEDAADSAWAHFGRQDLAVRDKATWKGEGVDLVTEADMLVHEQVREGLAKIEPGVAVVSEEDQLHEGRGPDECFILDPIDGTHNFANGLPWWVVSLARTRGGEVEEAWILDRSDGVRYRARRGEGATADGEPIQISARPARLSLASIGWSHAVVPLLLAQHRFAGIRVMGSHVLSQAWVACGRFAVHVGRGFPWDVAAGSLLVRESGGMDLTFAGEPRDPWKREHSLCGTPEAVEICLEILAASKANTED